MIKPIHGSCAIYFPGGIWGWLLRVPSQGYHNQHTALDTHELAWCDERYRWVASVLVATSRYLVMISVALHFEWFWPTGRSISKASMKFMGLTMGWQENPWEFTPPYLLNLYLCAQGCWGGGNRAVMMILLSGLARSEPWIEGFFPKSPRSITVGMVVSTQKSQNFSLWCPQKEHETKRLLLYFSSGLLHPHSECFHVFFSWLGVPQLGQRQAFLTAGRPFRPRHTATCSQWLGVIYATIKSWDSWDGSPQPLKLTASWHLKMDGWKMRPFPFGVAEPGRCYVCVSFRECYIFFY